MVRLKYNPEVQQTFFTDDYDDDGDDDDDDDHDDDDFKDQK